MPKRSKNLEPSAYLGKNVVVTVGSTVTQKHVPVARLELSARSVIFGLRWYIYPNIGGGLGASEDRKLPVQR